MLGDKPFDKNKIIYPALLITIIAFYFCLIYSFGYYAELQKYTSLLYWAFPIFYVINEIFYSILSKNKHVSFNDIKATFPRSPVLLFIWLIMLFLFGKFLDIFSPSAFFFFPIFTMILSLLYIILLEQTVSRRILRITITFSLFLLFYAISHEFFLQTNELSPTLANVYLYSSKARCSENWRYNQVAFDGCVLLGSKQTSDRSYNCTYACPKKNFIKITDLSAYPERKDNKMYAYLKYHINTKGAGIPKDFTVEIFENGSLKLSKKEANNEASEYLRLSDWFEINKAGEYQYVVKVNSHDSLNFFGKSDPVRLSLPGNSALIIEQTPDNTTQSKTIKVFPDLTIKDIFYDNNDQYHFTYCNDGNFTTENNLTIKIKSDPPDFIEKEIIEAIAGLAPKECRDTQKYTITAARIKLEEKKDITFTIDPENSAEEIKEDNNILAKPLSFFVTEGKCFDSDGGLDYYTSGSAMVKRGNESRGYIDTCRKEIDSPSVLKPGPYSYETGPYLLEAICGKNNESTKELYACPNGCANGVCIK